MFTELFKLLADKKDSLTFTVALAETSTAELPLLRVTVLPKLSGDAKLNKPVVLTGTPAELDSPDLTAQLTAYAESVVDVRSSLTELAAANKAEASTNRTTAAAKKAKKSGGGGTSKTPAKTKPAAKPAPKKSDRKHNPLLNRAKRPAAAAAKAPEPKPESPEPETPPAPKNAEEATSSLL